MSDEDALKLKRGDRVRLISTGGTVQSISVRGVLIQWDDWPFYPDFHPLPCGLMAIQKEKLG